MLKGQNPFGLWREYLRLFVENHEAQQVPEVRGPEGLPLQQDHVEGCLDGCELQQLGLTYDTGQRVMVNTGLGQKMLNKAPSAQLTGCLVPVGAPGNVVLLVATLGARDRYHFLDFRHAEFGVVVEEGAAALDGEVVLGPVPQLAQVLVVQCVERVGAIRDKRAIKILPTSLVIGMPLPAGRNKSKHTLPPDVPP